MSHLFITSNQELERTFIERKNLLFTISCSLRSFINYSRIRIMGLIFLTQNCQLKTKIYTQFYCKKKKL